MQLQTEQAHIATCGTLFFSLLGIQDISAFANIIFVAASTISCTISIILAIRQLKKK